MWRGQLFVTGRIKDMIIINGANFYPIDIEEVVRRCNPSIRPGSVVAFSSHDEQGKERLGVIAELRYREGSQEAEQLKASLSLPSSLPARIATTAFRWLQNLPSATKAPILNALMKIGSVMRVCRRRSSNKSARDDDPASKHFTMDELRSVVNIIRRAVISNFGIAAADVTLCKPRSVLKTSSGKVRRFATSELVTSGQMEHSGCVLLRSVIQPSPPSRAENSSASSMTLPAGFDEDTSVEVMSDDEVKRRVLELIADNLQLPQQMVNTLSEEFKFDETKSLDEYGLDSVTAMKLAAEITRTFHLQVPLSPFMLFNDPSLDGLCAVIQRLMRMRAKQYDTRRCSDHDENKRSTDDLPMILGR